MLRIASTASPIAGRAAFLAAACVGGAAAAQTPAGTVISNTAEVSYTLDGAARTGRSNTVTFTVGERLDVGLAAQGAPPTLTREPTPAPFVVTNMGTGEEAFAVTATASAGAKVEMVALDVDGDGRFDPGKDRPLTGATPTLAPGETVALVAVIAPVADPVDGTLTVAARAETGSGEIDRAFPGQGDNGGDAVVGRTGAIASAALPFVAERARPTLDKSWSARAPDGSSTPASGALVTYTLVARFPAGGWRAARIDDPVPEGTVYLPGSLMLDGAALSDAADADAGACDGRRVSVALGDAAAAATRTVTFQVRLP